MNYIIHIDTLDKRIGISRFGCNVGMEMTPSELRAIADQYELDNWASVQCICEEASCP